LVARAVKVMRIAVCEEIDDREATTNSAVQPGQAGSGAENSN
jgi:hypothetical protein